MVTEKETYEKQDKTPDTYIPSFFEHEPPRFSGRWMPFSPADSQVPSKISLQRYHENPLE